MLSYSKSANVGWSIVSSPQTSLLCVWHSTMPQYTRLVQSILRVLLWVNRVVRGDEDETVRGQCIPVAAEFIVGQCIEMDGGQAT